MLIMSFFRNLRMVALYNNISIEMEMNAVKDMVLFEP